MTKHSRATWVLSIPLALLVTVLSAGPLHAGGFGCDNPAINLATTPTELVEGDVGSTPVDYVIDVDQVDDVCLVEITYQTQDGTATGGEDYGPVEPTTAHRCGIGDLVDGSLAVFGDTLLEGDETFDVLVTSVSSTCSETCGCVIIPRSDAAPRGGGIGSTVTILNDDQPALSIDDVQVEEGDSGTTNAVFTVRAEPLTLEPIAVFFATADGTATVADNDYQERSDVVTIEPVAPFQATITVPIVGDTRREENETFTVEIGVKGGATIADGEGVGTILNDDGEPAISIDDVEVVEGDSGQTAAVFTVTVSPLTQEVSASFATQDDTATAADGDYVSTSGSLSFPFGGSPTQTISVPVRGDTRAEPDETFHVVLSGVDGATVAKGEGVGTILNDDENSVVRIASAPPASEAAGTATVVVERLNPSGDPARVTVNAREGTATAGADFTPVTAVASWGADEGGTRTIQIALLDDNLAEGDETIRVTLTNPVEATLGSPSTVDLVLLDDEQEGEVEILGDAEPEGVVELEADLAVRVRTADGSPIEGARVFWTVEEGEAELTSGSPTLSGGDGVSRQTVELGEIPGIVLIRATLNPSAGAPGDAARAQQEQTSVVFRLRVRGAADLNSDADLDPDNLSVGGVLDFACIEPEGQFADFCRYLFGLDEDLEREVVQEATPREVAAQGSLMLDLPQWGFREVGRRLAALRGGGSRRVEEELALVVGREEVRVAALVDTVADAMARQARFEEALEGAVEAMRGGGQGSASGGGQATEEPQPRMDDALDTAPRLGVFVSGRVATADRDGTEREEGFDAGIEGVTVGADYRVRSDLILGGAAGYLKTDLDLLQDGGGLDADGYSLTAYGAWLGEALYVDGVLGYGRNSFDLRRHVDLPVPFEGVSRFVARGDTDGTQWMANLGSGWERAFGASSLELYGRASYVEADLDGYRERGGGPFDLAIQDQSLDSLLAELGLNFGYAASREWGVLQPVVRAAALHEFGDDSRLVRGSFIQDVHQFTFVVPTDAPDRNFFNLGIGLTATTYRGRSFFVFYDTDLGRDDLEVGTFTLGARFEF
ncbi:MAG: autotransporter domain-containing protein [Thermoanaerobaculia bacterium]